MIHYASPAFWAAYRRLPQAVRRQADRQFSLLQENPRHPSLHFKRIGKVWSARIGLHYRALAMSVEDGLLWFWIGSHADYDRLIGRRPRRGGR